MNGLSQLLSWSVQTAEISTGGKFLLNGENRTGTIDRHKKGTKLTVGGFEVAFDSILDCSLPQFLGVPPATGGKVLCDGFRYTIVDIEVDGSSYKLFLKGLAQ